MPAVPTVSESGLKDFSIVYWLGIFVPAKTPQPVIDKLYGAFKASLDSAPVREKLMESGQVVEGTTPAAFATKLDADIGRWKTVIDAAKIELQ